MYVCVCMCVCMYTSGPFHTKPAAKTVPMYVRFIYICIYLMYLYVCR
jgi:hypothetical protein